MAKKTSRNAVKKINKQLEMFSSSPKNNSKKSSTQKKNVKKSTTSSSKSRTSVRDTVVIPVEKQESPKKKSSSSNKNIREEVVVAPQKKSTSTTKKKSTGKNVRGEVVVTTTKSRSTTKRTTSKKSKNIIDPIELDHNVESIINDIERDIKNDDSELIVLSDKVEVKKEEKKLTEKEYEELKLDKPIDLDNFDLLDDYKIIDEFEEDIYKDKKKEDSSKSIFSKNKKRIINSSKKSSYRELESDLRSLYDKVNDVVSDIDHNDRKKIIKDNIDLNDRNKNKLKENYKDKIEEYEIDYDIKPEKPSLLDHISQKVLNFFLIFLLIIFTGMTIAFIWFLIYVSTF